MSLELRPPTAEDASELGRICYEAFKDISDRHHFPPDFESVALPRMFIGLLIQREDVFGVKASIDGQPAGSNFLMTSDEVGGVGPITIEVSLQGRGIGRALMTAVLDHAREANTPMVRLVQDSFNMTSLSLYASLGFDVRSPLILLQPQPAAQPDTSVRPMTREDLPAVDELSRRIYKVSRRNEVEGSLPMFPSFVRELQGRISGYLVMGMIGHGVFETEDDAVATVGEATRQSPPDFHRVFCPLLEGSLHRRFLATGARAVKPMNLMSFGPYEPPDGVWMPSVLY
jgi:GNAT superfamily N-acetyltransferase